MGRSYLSIKLAAVFGLLVAAAVTAQDRSLQRDALVQRAEMTAGAAVPTVRAVDSAVHVECELSEPAHTPRATARAPRAAAARQS